MALDSVRSHKFRSFLTVLGIVIGVMTAITIASILTGLRQNIVAMIEEYGTNNIYAFHLSTGPRVRIVRNARANIYGGDAELSSAGKRVMMWLWCPKCWHGGGPFDEMLLPRGTITMGQHAGRVSNYVTFQHHGGKGHNQ